MVFKTEPKFLTRNQGSLAPNLVQDLVLVYNWALIHAFYLIMHILLSFNDNKTDFDLIGFVNWRQSSIHGFDTSDFELSVWFVIVVARIFYNCWTSIAWINNKTVRLSDARRDTWWRHKRILYKFVKKCDRPTEGRTHGHTDKPFCEMLLASKMYNFLI